MPRHCCPSPPDGLQRCTRHQHLLEGPAARGGCCGCCLAPAAHGSPTPTAAMRSRQRTNGWFVVAGGCAIATQCSMPEHPGDWLQRSTMVQQVCTNSQRKPQACCVPLHDQHDAGAGVTCCELVLCSSSVCAALRTCSMWKASDGLASCSFATTCSTLSAEPSSDASSRRRSSLFLASPGNCCTTQDRNEQQQGRRMVSMRARQGYLGAPVLSLPYASQ